MADEKPSRLKILAVGDLHGDSRQAVRLAERAKKEKVDLVILAGDIVSYMETKNLIKPFKDNNQKVLIIPGNHDSFATTDFMAEIYGVSNIHGYSVKYKGIGIFGAGGAVDFNISEKELFETLKKGHDALKNTKKTIMVTHMHAAGTKSEFSGFEGSKSIREAIEKFKPEFLLHAHIHEAEGIEEKIGKTRVINVGKAGRIIEI
ncbi:MAG: metallophosphoesterase [Candidatus Paceibacterota bacterium]